MKVLTPWAAQETEVSQAQELLQPIAYKPVSPQIFTNHYQGSPSKGQSSSQPQSEPQPNPPPKPPKLPEVYQDGLEQNIEATPQDKLDSTQSSVRHYEPLGKQEQHQQRDLLERPQRRAEQAIYRTAEPTGLPGQQQDISTQFKLKLPRHLDQPTVKNGTGQSHATQSKQEHSSSPTVNHDIQNEHDDNHDIRWMLPLIEDHSGSNGALSSQLENPALPYQPQRRVVDDLQSFPSTTPSSTQLASSAGASNEKAVRQSHDSSSRQHDIPLLTSDIKEHQHNGSFYGNSSHSFADFQGKDCPPSLSNTEASNNAINPHGSQKSASASTHQSDEESENNPSIAQPTVKTHHASGLGFGGPSDWEHFGDHQAEEVDDTDLYSRNRSPTIIIATLNSTELPADSLPFSNLPQHEQSRSVPAPSSGTISSQSSSQPPSHPPFKSTTVHMNPTQETVKPVLGLQHGAPLAVRNSETEHSTDNGGAVPGNAGEIDMDEPRRVWLEYPALSNDQAHSTLDKNSASSENSSLRFSSNRAQDKIICSEVSTPVPTKALPRMDDSAYQWQSAEVNIETIPGAGLIKTRISSEFKTNNSTLGNKLQCTDTKASIGGAVLLIPLEDPTQQGQVAVDSQEFNTGSRSESQKISSTSKADVLKARRIEDKPGSRGSSTTIEISESSPRSNESIHQQRFEESFVNLNPDSQLNNPIISPLSSKEKFFSNQSRDEMSKSNDSIHHRRSMEDLMASTRVLLASSTVKVAQPQRTDETPMSNDTIHQRHSTEGLMTVTPDFRSSSARVSMASFTEKGFETQITIEKGKSNENIYPLNFAADEPGSNPNDLLDSSRIRLGPKHNTVETENPEHGSVSNDSTHERAMTKLHNKAGFLESNDHVLLTENGENISKEKDESSAVKTSKIASPLEQMRAIKSSEVVDEAIGRLTPAMHEHSKGGPQQIVDPEVGITAPSKPTEPDTPYAELDPWGRASLNRYVAMLNDEAKAKTDKEKFNVFMIFANRETRLRAVLYGADDGTAATQQVLKRSPSKHIAETLTKRPEKALPALPPVGEPKPTPILDGYSEKLSAPQGIQVVRKPRSLILRENSRPDQPSGLITSLAAESPSDDMQYSPGGRPIVARALINGDIFKKPAAESTLREKVSKVFTHVAALTYSIPSPGSDAPMVVGPEASVGSENLAYVPLNYICQGEPTESASSRQPAYRPYAALKESLNGGPKIAIDSEIRKEGISDTSAVTSFSKPIQNSSLKGNEESVSALPSSDEKCQKDVPFELRRFVRADFDPLISVLPASEKVPKGLLQLQDMKNAMDAVPDDFSFIHQSLVDWDAEARKEREIHERERHVRQGESERKIDALFDDHEIGYGDISELESEFKSSEAARKADEDRAEFQTFLSNVFDVVWTRLHFELAQLTPLYEEYSQTLNDTLVGKDLFEGSANKLALAPTMNLLLALHQKLEIRHQKAFEAVLERDRRLKKTEVSPWYTLGNVAKVKQLEKQFDSAEKKATIDYYKQRNGRANKLIDVLDHNTLRGVGANQDYMEAIMKSIRRIASGRAFASMPSSESGLGVEEVMKAKSITTIIASSSEQIVQTFHVADMLLNASYYDLLIANAKLANADAKVFARLKEERSKEDQKLMGSLEHRLAPIREDSRRTNDEIVKLLLFLGVQNGHAQSSPKGTLSPLADTVRADRIPNTSSEEAKWR